MAETLQLAGKYTLNELTPDERTQFEEHLFDCPVCSDEVRQSFTVIENLKQVFREDRATSRQASTVKTAGWRDWFRMPSLIPTMAALAFAGILVVQNTGTSNAIVGEVLSPTAFVGPVSRGESQIVRVDRKLPAFLLSFPVDAAKADAFVCEFENSNHQEIVTLKSDPQATASLNLPVLLPTATFPAGNYTMRLHPVTEPDSITTYSFLVQDKK